MLKPDTLLHDLRVALRGLRRDIGFTSTALVTFALCLGANIALFAILNAVVLRPLPYPKPSELVTIYNTYPKAGVERAGASVPHFLERRTDIDAIVEAAAFRGGAETVGETGATDRIASMNVTPGFFKVLGVTPALGRTFTEEEGTYGKNNVILISDAFWRERFAGAPDVLGKTLRLGGGSNSTIIGVMPPSFDFDGSKARLWTPLCFSDDEKKEENRHSNNMEMIARLKPGVSLVQAQTQVDALNRKAAAKDPYAALVADAGFATKVADLHADRISSTKSILLLLQAGVLCLLLIGAVNLANLLLVRAISRTKETSIRRVLGAGNSRLVRQILSETILLSLFGALLGLALGAASLKGMALLGTEDLPHSGGFSLDGMVILAALGGAVLLGFLLALPVLWHSLRGNLAASLSVESRGGTTTKATHRLRHGLIIVQFALAFVLLNGAGLLGLSFLRVAQVKPGFQPSHLLTASVSLPWNSYKETPDRIQFMDRLEQELKSIPGLESTGFATTIPFTNNVSQNGISIEGLEPKPGENLMAHYFTGVSGRYFESLGIPLRQGRFLTSDDTLRKERVCVIDEDAARRYWPNGDALGHRLFNGPPSDKEKPFTIVGVVGTIRQRDLSDKKATGAIYVPYSESASLQIALLAKSTQSTQSLGLALRKAVARIDPELPLEDVKPMELRIDESLKLRKAPFILAVIFAGVALLLAAIGLYGVLAYTVAQRRREIGIRMALGALPGQLSRQFLLLGLRLVLIGATLGLLGAWLGGQAMSSQLYGVNAMDPLMLSIVGALLSAIALTACLRPSLKAANTPPWSALKAD